MKHINLKKYLIYVIFLFIFSLFSSTIIFRIANKKKEIVKVKKKLIVKKPPKKIRFISKKDFNYFLNFDLEKVDSIDVEALSFIAIEELYNTSRMLVDILYLKKIKLLLKNGSKKKSDSKEDIESLLNKIISKNTFIRRSRDYILLRLKFEQKKYDLFISDYEKNKDVELKESLSPEYISCLLFQKENNKAIEFFKSWYLFPQLKISELESVFSKNKLKVLFNSFSKEDWIKSFVYFVTEDKQGTINKLSNYIKSRQLRALYLAEYNYGKKRYSRARTLLKQVKDKDLLGLKKRILYKIRLRSEKYDLLLTQTDEMSEFPHAYRGFLLNGAKLLMKDRTDLSKLLFEKYISECKKDIISKKQSETEVTEYWGAMWRLAWLYYRNTELDKAKKLLKEIANSKILSYKISAEFWLSGLEKRGSKLFEKHPFSYYYIAYLKRKGIVNIKKSPDSFHTLFPKKRTKRLDKIIKNIKMLLKYGLLSECSNYIDDEVNKKALNKTEKNFLKFIPLILAEKEGKYGKSIWSYSRNFKNYRAVQLPSYLSNIIFPTKYIDIVQKYSKIKQIDPNLVMALIKQESTFKAEVISPSKAYGLMQLIMSTASKMAKKYKQRVSKANLFIPDVNIKYGVEYLKDLLDKYSGNIYYALAAYNAGDHRVDNWLPQMGKVTNEEFVEMIPFTETRNYVKLVIRNYYYYKFYNNFK